MLQRMCYYIDSGETNFTEGIVRMMNNRNLYVRLLSKFIAADNLIGLRDAVNSGDAEKIRVEAHTLKGVAANLGLTGLSAKAAALDYAVRDGHMDQVNELMASVEESYKLTLADIDAYIAG